MTKTKYKWRATSKTTGDVNESVSTFGTKAAAEMRVVEICFTCQLDKNFDFEVFPVAVEG